MATQSLYRRYRPRRFSELKGQDHVVRALRDAVATGREGQAYLFSGPRGTGKTTSARILAKVLNCNNVTDGEPCCECESCLAVERGTSYDVHELDAASNNGVDAIRELIEKAALGTPGRHKVYILDEVHMLSKPASAALLKTLEEPPPHVVFVLATTDPQKVLDTIRSRTQHLQFHLLPSDTLAEHIKWVAEDAGYDLPPKALDAALTRGGGSARDTLSALELLATTGGDTTDAIDVDEFMAALIERNPGRVLTAMGSAVALGHDPRAVTEEVVRHLRNGFLSLMAPELVLLPPDRLDAVAAQANEFGPAGLVRAIEALGRILVEMRHAPDPRILVEVALVQLTSDEAGGDVDVLAARLERLEHQVDQLGRQGGRAPAPEPPRDESTGRAKLGGAAQRPTAAPPAEPAESPAGADDAATPAPEPAAAARPPDAPSAAEPAAARAVSVPEAWRDTVRAQLKPLVRALFSAGEFAGSDGDVWVFTVPNAAHGAKCDEHRAEVEAALATAVGGPVRLRIEAAGVPVSAEPSAAAAPAASAPPRPEPAPPAESGAERAARAAAASPDPDPTEATAPTELPEADEDVDLSELTDAPPESVKTPIDRIAEAFPGSELITDE